MWTYRLRYVKCGKRGCHCRDGIGLGHGPYWYGYERQGNRVRERYFGQYPQDHVEAPPHEAPRPGPKETSRWTFHGKMNLAIAYRIFGVTGVPTKRDLTDRWRRLIWDHHPDRGGTTEVAASINAAYTFLKEYAL